MRINVHTYRWWCCYKVRWGEVYIRTLGKWTPWARLIPAPPPDPQLQCYNAGYLHFCPGSSEDQEPKNFAASSSWDDALRILTHSRDVARMFSELSTEMSTVSLPLWASKIWDVWFCAFGWRKGFKNLMFWSFSFFGELFFVGFVYFNKLIFCLSF